MSQNQFSEMPVGSLVTRVASYTQSMSDLFTDVIVSVVRNVVTVVGVYAIMFVVSWRLACLMLIPITVISILIGIPGGYWLTNYIFTEAIGDNYDFFAMINGRTYLIGMAGTLAISVLSTLYLARKLKKIDMVSSLKANE